MEALFTLSDFLEKPWSWVPFPSPPRYLRSLLPCMGFAIPPFLALYARPLSSNFANSPLAPTSIFTHEKPVTSTMAHSVRLEPTSNPSATRVATEKTTIAIFQASTSSVSAPQYEHIRIMLHPFRTGLCIALVRAPILSSPNSTGRCLNRQFSSLKGGTRFTY